MSTSGLSSPPSSPIHEGMSREELKRRIATLEAKMKAHKKEKKRNRGHKSDDKERKKRRWLKEARNTVEKELQTIMEKCKARGFVYCFHPDITTVVHGASESLDNWWREVLPSHRHDPEARENDQIISDHSNIGNLEHNDAKPSPKNSKKDEAP